MDGVEFDRGDNDGADLDSTERDGVNFVAPNVDVKFQWA